MYYRYNESDNVLSHTFLHNIPLLLFLQYKLIIKNICNNNENIILCFCIFFHINRCIFEYTLNTYKKI